MGRELIALLVFTASGKKGNLTIREMRTVWNCPVMAGMITSVVKNSSGSARSPQLCAQPSEGHCPPLSPLPPVQSPGSGSLAMPSSSSSLVPPTSVFIPPELVLRS